jgi:hypothetical protein
MFLNRSPGIRVLEVPKVLGLHWKVNKETNVT